jgi:hypothetical protein
MSPLLKDKSTIVLASSSEFGLRTAGFALQGTYGRSQTSPLTYPVQEPNITTDLARPFCCYRTSMLVSDQPQRPSTKFEPLNPF